MPLPDSVIDSISQWSTDNIKADLKRNKLKQSGSKSALVDRLQAFYRQKAIDENPDSAPDNLQDGISAQPGSSNNTAVTSISVTRHNHAPVSHVITNTLAGVNVNQSYRPPDYPTTQANGLASSDVYTGGHSQQVFNTPGLATYGCQSSYPSHPVMSIPGSESNPSRPTPWGYEPVHGPMVVNAGLSRDVGGIYQNPGAFHAINNSMFDSRFLPRPGSRYQYMNGHRSTPLLPSHIPRPVEPYHLNPAVGETATVRPPFTGGSFYGNNQSPLPDRPRVNPTIDPTVRQQQHPQSHIATPHIHQHGANMASTRLDSRSTTGECSELKALEEQLKILRTKEEIRNATYRLTLTPEESNQYPARGTDSSSGTEFSHTMLELVKKSVDISKQSVDINSLPPSKPFTFSGNRIDYPRWKSTFELMVETKLLLPCQKLIYLGQFLDGEAHRAVKGYISQNTTEAYMAARAYLDWKYGDPYDMADAYRERLETWKKLCSNDIKGLNDYAEFLGEILVATSSNLELSTLNDPRILRAFPNALPEHLAQKWSRLAGSMKYDQGRHASFEQYCQFVRREAFLANDNTTSMEAIRSSDKNPGRTKLEKTAVAHTTNTTESISMNPTRNNRKPVNSKATLCHMCKLFNDHNTAECEKVSGLDNEKLQDFISKERLCFLCMRKGHMKAQCNIKLTCLICHQEHATCLHKTHEKKNIPNSSSTPLNAVVSNRVCGERPSGLTSLIIPVYVSLDGKVENEVMVYALIDSQSDASFIDKNIIHPWDTDFPSVKLEISTVTTQKKVVDCLAIPGLHVRGICSQEPIIIARTYTQDCIPGKRDHIPTPDTAKHWKHLQDIQNKLSPLQDCEIGLLIGYNCPAASFPLNSVKSTPMEPYGIETPLGWMIVGGVPSESDGATITHRIRSRELSSDEILRCLQETIESDNDVMMSQNDLAFLKLMESELTISGGFYTMPLPFEQELELPNNRNYAVKRFHLLEKKFSQNPLLRTRYHEFMSDILTKGEAERCDIKDTGAGWYIPHFGVFNHHKPDKLRVVFDCSASFRGHSLNQSLLQGPDLNSSLAGLLCRFRKERVAITCDIKKMFHQFRVNREHRKYLKFIWYKGDGSSELTDYHMNVHLFGAVSSPSCAIYGLQQLARDFAKVYPLASSFILDNFYVDDGLISVPTVQDAVQLIKEATALTKEGNLTLHKFLSNDSIVAQTIGCEGPVSKDLSSDKDMTTRALGLCWDVSTDSFHFSDKIPERAVSRRGILSTVASMYDPLGLISPFTLTGKLFIQELCREKKSWDAELSTEQEARWEKWLDDLGYVKNIVVARCFLSNNYSYANCDLELHTFSDACEYGYGTCSYLRIIRSDLHEVSMSLVMGKARVAPLKVLTMPRLELQAATLAAKISDFLLKELCLDELEAYYWTDSKTVLGYICNEEKRYHTFVLNRVNRIRESTSAKQWHYVPTADNPADIASRGATLENLPSSWFSGPMFLQNPDYHMRDLKSPYFPVKADDPEVKRLHVVTHAAQTGESHDFLQIFDKFSSWNKVVNIFKLVLKFGSKQTEPEHINSNDMAFAAILKLLQKSYLTAELDKLNIDAPVPKSSCLYKLDPFIAENGVLRVGGRLKDALSPYKVRHPAVMPSQAHLTRLYVQHIHRQTGHQGRNVTVNHVRANGVHLSGHGSRMVSSMVFRCIKCLKIRGQPAIPKMADLSPARVEPTAPFTHTGMDVFGPYHCKDGRKEVKRYGLIFSCMSTRAVHLEMLNDMTTDSLINSLRCFLALRGSVKSLLCDRGTNFIGARNELEKAIEVIEDQKLQEFLRERQCSFKLNVPTASHMSGSWERMIRIIRNVMAGILCEQASTRLDSSGLRTLMYECMAIVNSRPLSTAQIPHDSSIEPVPLTPNMMLTMKTVLPTSPGEFTEGDLHSRKQWRRIQYLSEQFWARWRLEYLQQLQSRQKWNRDGGRGVKLHDVVLLMDDNAPRSIWKLAKVIETSSGSDGRVRKVKLKLGEGHDLERPVHKLIVLVPSEINSSEKN